MSNDLLQRLAPTICSWGTRLYEAIWIMALIGFHTHMRFSVLARFWSTASSASAAYMTEGPAPM